MRLTLELEKTDYDVPGYFTFRTTYWPGAGSSQYTFSLKLRGDMTVAEAFQFARRRAVYEIAEELAKELPE